MMINEDEDEARLSPFYFSGFSWSFFISDSVPLPMRGGVPDVGSIDVEKRCVSTSFVCVVCCILLYVYIVLCV